MTSRLGEYILHNNLSYSCQVLLVGMSLGQTLLILAGAL